MKKLLYSICLLLSPCLHSIGAEYRNISKLDWTLNGKKVTLPHSYEYRLESGRITNEIRAPAGTYRVTLPKDVRRADDGSRYFLRIDGGMQSIKVLVNGVEVGWHETGFVPETYEITGFLNDTETNSLKIVTTRMKYLTTGGDYLKFLGLFADVWLIKTGNGEDFSPYKPLAKPKLSYGEDGFFHDDAGQRVFLKGVNYHAYFPPYGTFDYDYEREREDLMLIKQMGANAIRTSHYPRNQRFYDTCDELGLYVFTEIPLNGTMETNNVKYWLEYAEKTIRAYGHHPCIIAWGIFNELHFSYKDEVVLLRDYMHKLDPSRPTYGASNMGVPLDISPLPDIVGINIYDGWYKASVESMPASLKSIHRKTHHPAFFITEYGAGGNIDQKSSDVDEQAKAKMKPIVSVQDNVTNVIYRPLMPSKNPWQPADYQLYYHEKAWDAISNSPYCKANCAGAFIWQMIDSAAPRREGGSTNLNTKGLMTIDRKPKPAYEFYKKVW